MITGAQAVVDCLRREKIDHVFGIPGTMNLPILDVLRATPEIRFVLTRHEQGAAFMAYGFARALNRHECRALLDRKSTRLNSSHANISYAVFCLKKKRYQRESCSRDERRLAKPRRTISGD